MAGDRRVRVRWGRVAAVLAAMGLATALAVLAAGLLGQRGMQAPAPIQQGTEQAPLTISLVGDVLPAAGAARVAQKRGMAHLLGGVGRLLRGDDLTIANLECAVTTRGRPADKRYTFRAQPRLVAGLRAGGIEAVSLANNHSLDYGRQGLLDTLAYLRQGGVAAAGAGRDYQAANRPLVLEVRGRRVALVAASRVLPRVDWRAGRGRPGLASAYEGEELAARVRAAAKGAQVVVAYLHWGQERELTLDPEQRKLARALIAAGADLVAGCHSHTLQGFELYRGRLIAYGLGNFVFSSRDRQTVVLQVTFRGDGRQQARVIPCRVKGYRPEPMTGREGAALLRELEHRSPGVRIQADGTLEAAPD